MKTITPNFTAERYVLTMKKLDTIAPTRTETITIPMRVLEGLFTFAAEAYLRLELERVEKAQFGRTNTIGSALLPYLSEALENCAAIIAGKDESSDAQNLADFQVQASGSLLI